MEIWFPIGCGLVFGAIMGCVITKILGNSINKKMKTLRGVLDWRLAWICEEARCDSQRIDQLCRDIEELRKKKK